MRIFVTGGTGVLGRGLIPRLRADGHDVSAPAHKDLDLFSPPDVFAAMAGSEAVYHLATRIPPPERMGQPGAWDENDRLRSVATRVLVDAALQCGVSLFVLPSVTFIYPSEGPADEDTPVATEPGRLQSMLDAEAELRRFGLEEGKRHVILRLGLLWGPGTGNDTPDARRGATLHIEDAAEALRLALGVPAGVYNVVADGERISNARFKAAGGWKPAY